MSFDDDETLGFIGFRERDFEQINDTHWRKELGPELVNVMGKEFKAWPIYRWQGLHIGPEKLGQPELEHAKFFVHMEENASGVRFGLYIESAKRAAAIKFVHWRSFRNGLVEDEKFRELFTRAITKY